MVEDRSTVDERPRHPSGGVCPVCGTPGPIGARCPTATCARRGYHAIPTIEAPAPDAEVFEPFVGRRFGAFLVVRPLGRGGMGSVYLGIDEQIGQRVAIKVLAPGAGENEVERAQRFRLEATALARLDHPNIVKLIAFGFEGGLPYLVMEYVSNGRTLGELMAQGVGRGIERDVAARILVQLSHALDAAHAGCIVHRDIKPANVMLQSTAVTGHFVRLVDFGLAKFTDDGRHTRNVAGTPRYMAPEQVSRGDIGPWTDFYALGVLTFEMLTGQRLFGETQGFDLMRRKSRGEAGPDALPESVGCSVAMRRFLAATLAEDVRQRIATGAAFREGLETLLEAEARAAEVPEARFVAHRRRPRRWSWPAVGAMVAASLILGVLVGAFDRGASTPQPGAQLAVDGGAPVVATPALDGGASAAPDAWLLEPADAALPDGASSVADAHRPRRSSKAPPRRPSDRRPAPAAAERGEPPPAGEPPRPDPPRKADPAPTTLRDVDLPDF